MRPIQASPEHEFEAQPGLPEALPADERILWQGSPSPRLLARQALHTRMLSVYFAVLIAWRGATVLSGGGSGLDALVAMAWLLPLAGAAIATLTGLAWLIARTSVYTVTDKRVVMRIGVVLNITFNLPFTTIASAGLRRHADGSGDITLALAGADQIAYVHLWPHARPWKLARTEPMLRALPDAPAVAALLAGALTDALADAASDAASESAPMRPQRVPATAPLPVRTTSSEPNRQPLAA